MDLKKSYKANLERRRHFHLFLGLVITLSLILISFEWTTVSTKLADVHSATEIFFEEEMIQITRREEVKPPQKNELPPVLRYITGR